MESFYRKAPGWGDLRFFLVCCKVQSTGGGNKLAFPLAFPSRRRKEEGILRFALRRELLYSARTGGDKPRVRRETLGSSP